MGSFQAYRAEDDGRVEDSDWPSADSPIAVYYKKILQGAFPSSFKSNEDLSEVVVPVLDDFTKSFERRLNGYGDPKKKFWDISNDHICGYIASDAQYAQNYETILRKMAEEEERYYYKWEDNGYKLADRDCGLDHLKRVSGFLAYKILQSPDNQRKIFWRQWQAQGLDTKKTLPIAISDNPITIATKSYFVVYVNPDAAPLFRDTNQDTSMYKFEKVEARYCKKITTKIPVKEIGSVTSREEAMYNPEMRQRLIVIELAKNGGGFELSGNRPPNPTARYSTLLKNKVDVLLNMFIETHREDIKSTSYDRAYQLPIGYKCFYYADDGTLKGFLSSVNVGEGRGGSGGYAMRADKLAEVDYKWCVNPACEDYSLAMLLSYLMGLDSGKLTDTKLTGYDPVNWPRDMHEPTVGPAIKRIKLETEANPPTSEKPVTGISLFHYYKKFQSGESRRNKPQAPSAPRVPSDKDDLEGQYFKLDNVSYRKWKKGDQFQGEELKTGKPDRLNAGSVMADTLRQFEIYPKMVNEKKPQITYAHLPATAFAEYVVNPNNNYLVTLVSPK